MAESAEDTNLEEIDMGDLDELDPDAVELPDTEDDLDLPDMEDSPFDLEGNADDLEDLDLETEAVGNPEDSGMLAEMAEDAAEGEEVSDFEFGEESGDGSETGDEEGSLVAEDEDTMIGEELTDEIDLAPEEGEDAPEADASEAVEGLDDLDDLGLEDNLDLAAEGEAGEVELEIADEEDPFSLEDDFAEPELAGDDPFDLAESEPELADIAEGEAADEGVEEPDLLVEVDTGIGDLADLEEPELEEAIPEPSEEEGEEDMGLEEVALGTAAAAAAATATAAVEEAEDTNTTTDKNMNGDKDESGALVTQAGPERLLNFQHEVVVEVARTKLTGEEITQITYGSIIELDKVAGEPVNLVLENKVIAHGEMVLINEDKLGIRIIGIMQE